MKRKQKDYRDYQWPVDRSYLTYKQVRKKNCKDIAHLPMRSRYEWPDPGCTRNMWRFIDSWLEGMLGRTETEVWSKFKTLLKWSSKQSRWYWWTWDIDDKKLECPTSTYYFNNERILCKYDFQFFKRKV